MTAKITVADLAIDPTMFARLMNLTAHVTYIIALVTLLVIVSIVALGTVVIPRQKRSHTGYNIVVIVTVV